MGISSRINNTRRKTRRNNKQRQSQKTKQKKYTQRRSGGRPGLRRTMNWIGNSASAAINAVKSNVPTAANTKAVVRTAWKATPVLPTVAKVLALPVTMNNDRKNRGTRSLRHQFYCCVCKTEIKEPTKFKTALLGSGERANVLRNTTNLVVNTNEATYYYNCPVCFHMYSFFSDQDAGQGEYKCLTKPESNTNWKFTNNNPLHYMHNLKKKNEE